MPNTKVVSDFNTPHSSKDKSPSQKICKETLELTDTMDQMDLIDIYRIFHPTIAEYTFFSSVCGIFSRIDHILKHKASFNK
jgi:exonuclease III